MSSQTNEKPYHVGDLRERLVLAGEAMLAQTTADQVTLREIARRSGVSHAAPKHHFASHSELMSEIAARGFDRFVSCLKSGADAATDQSPENRVVAMGQAYVKFATENRSVYNLMFLESARCLATQRLADAASRAWLQLEQATAAVVGQRRAPQAAALLFSAVHGFSLLHGTARMPRHAFTASTASYIARMIIAAITMPSDD